MGGGAGGGGRRTLSNINVTPFVDILLVLLVTFMATAIYIAKGSIPIKLPKASTGQPQVEKALLILSVDSEGNYLVKGEKVSDEELEAFVVDIVARKPNVEAVISGDRRVPYGRVMHLIDLVQSLGVKKFAAEVEKEEKVEK
jgi:biopolymer transport protein TolR